MLLDTVLFYWYSIGILFAYSRKDSTMSIQVKFTTGHISIRRGRITRKYRPSVTSIKRLSFVLFYGPAVHYTTNRSSCYAWHGLSSMDSNQKAVYRILESYQGIYNRSKERLHNQARTTNKYFHELPAYNENMIDLYTLLTAKECAIAVSIHKLMIELIDPCEHGHIQSNCVTCATTY